MAIFTAASEAFNRKNLNCSVEESLRKFDDMVAAAKAEGVAVRGYVSCVVGCPYQVGFVLRVVRGTSGRWWQWPGRWAPVAHMRGQMPHVLDTLQRLPLLLPLLPPHRCRGRCCRRMRRGWRGPCTRWAAMRSAWETL